MSVVPKTPEAASAAGLEEVMALVRALPPEKRRTLAIELAPRADAPRELMRLLAGDEIVIAEPVILHSPVLSEEDLREIAERGSAAHRARLRQRGNLPAAVALALDAPHVTESALIGKLRAHATGEFHVLFAELAGAEAASALDALYDGDGEKMARLCKAARLSRAAFSAIVLLADPSRRRSRNEIEALLASYDGGETQAEAA